MENFRSESARACMQCHTGEALPGCKVSQTSFVILATLKWEKMCHRALYAAIKRQKLGAAEPESTLQVAFVCFPMIPQPAVHFCQVFTFRKAKKKKKEKAWRPISLCLAVWWWNIQVMLCCLLSADPDLDGDEKIWESDELQEKKKTLSFFKRL